MNFLICTDVAARGLDVKGLPFMINVSLPDDKSNYVHRIGRVGRAERMGLAISLVSTVQEKVFLPLSCFSIEDKCFLFFIFRSGTTVSGASHAAATAGTPARPRPAAAACGTTTRRCWPTLRSTWA